ncbi:MAG: Ig-like domain repeat protein [Candidatus Hodarchaeota archaeon]
MQKYRSNIIILILMLSITGFVFSSSVDNALVLQTRNIQHLRNDSSLFYDHSFPTEDANAINQGQFAEKYSIQQENITSIITNNIDDDGPVSFIPNIWGNPLGTDPLVLADPLKYQNGIVYPPGDGLDSEALFIRIGNNGTDKSNLDSTLNTNISAGLSSGWRLEFNVTEDYDLVNISFKWRFDVFDPPAFDNFTELVPGVILDGSPDYQEIRCRISPPPSSGLESFWLGNPITNRNPNGTVFYRVGPTVTQDEEWFNFTGSFQVLENDAANYSLELGAFMNTREYWNEYFDVWFDNITIKGIQNATDTHSPQPIAVGLERTENVSRYNFWARFSEGLWEDPIENVTVFYTRTGTVNVDTNASLVYNDLATIITPAGYNQTYWNYTATVNFDDLVTYNFTIFDGAGNNYTTVNYQETIGDNSPPIITSNTDANNTNFIYQSGDGFVTISINASDWGYGIKDAFLFYNIDDGTQIISGSIPMNKMGVFLVNEVNHTLYQVTLDTSHGIKYGATLDVSIQLIDEEGNTKNYPNLVIDEPLDEDNIAPEISIDDVFPSTTGEGRTFVNITAHDPFGDVTGVYLTVKYLNNDSAVVKRDADGTILFDYSNIRLIYDNASDSWIIPNHPTKTPYGALRLRYDPSDVGYNITATVRDTGGFSVSRSWSEPYIPPDIVAPKVSITDLEYLYPGLLRVWVQATDLGSGVDSVTLEKDSGTGWIESYTMKYSVSQNLYYTDIQTSWMGNEEFEFRANAVDKVGNDLDENVRPTRKYTTQIVVTTPIGLLLAEIIVIIMFVTVFTAIKVGQRRRIRIVRRRRFDVALRRSERLAYLGEEAMFGFVAAFGQSESVSSLLFWEPRLTGYFYQYLKELADKANTTINFVMQTRPQDLVSFIDFKIEEIGCSAITFAYPVSTLPQHWLSSLTLEQVPMDPGQGVLLLMLLMREKWSEVAYNFQDEITEGIHEIKNLLLSGEDKETLLQKSREFRLFISGTVEVLEEIEIEADEMISDDIMRDFDLDFDDDQNSS